MAPTEAPELKIPWASARSLMGNHSALLLVAPGQFPASLTPSIARTSPSEATPRAAACSMIEIDQTTIARTNPRRVPIQSKILPNSEWPIA